MIKLTDLLLEGNSKAGRVLLRKNLIEMGDAGKPLWGTKMKKAFLKKQEELVLKIIQNEIKKIEKKGTKLWPSLDSDTTKDPQFLLNYKLTIENGIGQLNKFNKDLMNFGKEFHKEHKDTFNTFYRMSLKAWFDKSEVTRFGFKADLNSVAEMYFFEKKIDKKYKFPDYRIYEDYIDEFFERMEMFE